jgi:hypothetical protein
VAKKKKTAKPIDAVEVQDVEIEELPVVEKDVIVELKSETVSTDESTETLEEPAEAVAEEVPLELKKNSVWPLVFGGIVAAALGFVATRSNFVDNFLPPSWRMNANEVVLQEQIFNAQDEIDSLKEKLTEFSDRLEKTPQVVATDSTALTSVIKNLVARIDAIESRPVVVQGENADFTKLREVAERQQAEIDMLLADARLAEQTSQEAANTTLARAAASQIIAAIESGAPFETALADLEAAGAYDIPEALIAAAADGVVTLAALQDAIPAAAREGLAASPPDAEAGLGGFLKRQLGARSIAPREGGDADAVLSRVEGAVRQGRLTDALAEAESLSPEAKSAMSDWLENTATRLAVTTASETLMQRLAAN